MSSKIPFDASKSILSQYAHLSPIILVTTVNPNGTFNVSPKTQNTPVGREGNFFMFVCTPSHHTYQNIKTTKEFVVNYPTHKIIEQIGLTASVFEENSDEIEQSGLTAIPSLHVKPPRIAECSVHLECQLVEIKEYSKYAMIIGRIVAASGDENVVLDQDIASEQFSKKLVENPLLAYIYPGHITTVKNCEKFKFPEKYKP